MKRLFFPSSFPALPVVTVLFFAGSGARAATFTWAGAISNGWSNAGNWLGNAGPPNSGLTSSDIVYNGAPATFPDLTGGYSVKSITFNSASNGYDFNVGSLTLGDGGLTQNSPASEIFDLPVSLGTNSNWNIGATGTGTLAFNQGLAAGPYAFQINSTGSNTISGAISGSGGLTKIGSGTLTLTGASTFTSGTAVSGGTLNVASGGILSGGPVVVGPGAQLEVDGSVNVPGTLTSFGLIDGAAGNPAVLTVNGGSIDLHGGYIGGGGEGIVNQSDGAVLSTQPTYNMTLGALTGSTGTYNMSGGTFSTAGYLIVGYDGTGVINQSGGSFSAFQILLGYQAGSGTYNLNGGILTVPIIGASPGTSILNFNGGVLRAADDSTTFIAGVTAANVRGGGAVIDTNGHAITIGQALVHSKQGGDPPLDGGLVKLGNGTLTLTGANTFTGGVTIRAGTVQAANATFLGSKGPVNIQDGAGLVLTDSAANLGVRTYNLSAGSVLAPAGSGSALNYKGSVINGGSLGAGAHVLQDGAVLSGTRTKTGAILTASGGVHFSNVTLGGDTTLTQSAGTTITSDGEFIATPLTTLTLGGTVNVAGGYLSGMLTIPSGGSLRESGGATPLYLDGSRGVTVASGGDLRAASGSTIELGGVLTNNGKQDGTLNVNPGGIVQGNGTFGTVHVAAGGSFSATGTVSGAFVVDSGALISLNGAGQALKVQGAITNNGTIRFERGAAFNATGAAANFVNNGTIDIISGSATLPMGFINNGLVLDSRVVKVKAFARSASGDAVSVQIDGYPGHTYQLQRSSSLIAEEFVNVASVPAQSNPASNTAAVTLAFNDPSPLADQGFYRVQVDP